MFFINVFQNNRFNGFISSGICILFLRGKCFFLYGYNVYVCVCGNNGIYFEMVGFQCIKLSHFTGYNSHNNWANMQTVWVFGVMESDNKGNKQRTSKKKTCEHSIEKIAFGWVNGSRINV